jgi:sodium/bile acid cotransporter 7
VKQFFVERWFLLALVAVLVVGIVQASWVKPVADTKALRNGIVVVVLFVMALPLDARAMGRALRRPGPPLLAVAINLGLLPLVAWGISWALTQVELLSPTMAGGVYVAATTPCTLASAAVWTRRAGGNDAVAVLVTVITNLFCFLVTPLWLSHMVGPVPNVKDLALAHMIGQLGLLVVLPMAIAQVLRLVGPVGAWATRQRTPLGVVSQCGILTMVMLGASQIPSASAGAAQVTDFAWMIVVVLGIHVAMLAAGLWLAQACGFPREDRIAVGIAGSQKTLMIGLKMGLELNLSILPMVVYHMGQLVLDTVIADRLRKGACESRAKPASAQE